MDTPGDKLSVRGGYNCKSVGDLQQENCMTKIRKNSRLLNCEFKPDHRQEYADSWPNETDGTLSKEEWGFSLDFDLDSMCDVMIQSLRQ